MNIYDGNKACTSRNRYPEGLPEMPAVLTSAVVVGDRAYLVDFGPGVVRQAAKAYQQGIDCPAPDRLMIAFCTHLHTDHTAGYPDLIFTPWVLSTPEAAESIRSKRHPEHDRTYFKKHMKRTSTSVSTALKKPTKWLQSRNYRYPAWYHLSG